MGAGNKSVVKKFGNILINIKANKKSKVYIFNCAFCDANCDQLKKFSLHLDEKHSEQFSQGVSTSGSTVVEDFAKYTELSQDKDVKEDLGVFEPEVKVEELMEIEPPPPVDGNEESKNCDLTKGNGLHEDPLETKDSKPKRIKSLDINIKSEQVENESDDECGDVNVNTYDFHCNDMDYEDSVDGTESEPADSDAGEQENKKTRRRMCKTEKVFGSDASSDNSNDSDFEIDKTRLKVKRSYVKRTKKPTKVYECLNIDEKDLVLAILEAFEKQSILWEVKDRSHDRAVRQAAFQAIAKEVNDKLKIQIKWEDVRKRIKNMRDEYSREYDKQMKGEKCEMPWYTEKMKFLEENIKYLIKHRTQKKKYRRLKTLDESHIPLYIEYYKNCEILWQINNINFVVKPKKVEALKAIVEDIKIKHNIDINIYEVQRRLEYINRIYSADKEMQLKCEQDNTEFVPSSKFYNELSFLSDSQGPFKCAQCNEIIYKFETYHQHVAEHTNSVPFKCALCEMRFNKLHKYIVHAKRHLGINNYHCDFCGKGYPFRAELDWHVREHTGEEPYLCEICGASFRARHGYDNHIRRHENRFRYECHICKYGFNHLHALNAHVKAHLNIRDILCNVCGKGFTAKKHLLRHQQIHSDIKRYKCGVCGKAFAQDAGLRAHRKQHIEYTAHSEKGKKREHRKGNYKYD